MRSSAVLKFALAASLVLNLSFLTAAGYTYYQQSRSWTSPFGTKLEKGRFLFEELSLKPDQLKSLRERAIPFRAEIDKRRMEIGEKRKALIALLRQDNPDQKAVNAAIAGINRMQEEMQERIAAHMLEVKASLDRDQQQKFFDLIENTMAQTGQVGCPPGDLHH
ncbi:MAG: Spy/CpxP family protein refolding chaperone [Nitrospirota bacterium]